MKKRMKRIGMMIIKKKGTSIGREKVTSLPEKDQSHQNLSFQENHQVCRLIMVNTPESNTLLLIDWMVFTLNLSPFRCFQGPIKGRSVHH